MKGGPSHDLRRPSSPMAGRMGRIVGMGMGNVGELSAGVPALGMGLQREGKKREGLGKY